VKKREGQDHEFADDKRRGADSGKGIRRRGQRKESGILFGGLWDSKENQSSSGGTGKGSDFIEVHIEQWKIGVLKMNNLCGIWGIDGRRTSSHSGGSRRQISSKGKV